MTYHGQERQAPDNANGGLFTCLLMAHLLTPTSSPVEDQTQHLDCPATFGFNGIYGSSSPLPEG